jgi:RNA polymerase sigma-70 factor (ECF subfamily)
MAGVHPDAGEHHPEPRSGATRSAVESALAGQRARLVGYIRRKVSDPDVAEDLFQDSLLKALQKAGELRDGDRLVPWFYRMLDNAVTDYYRKRGSEARRQARLAFEATPAADGEEWRSLCECFRDLLPTLKPEYRDLIERLELSDEDPAAVSERLKISRNNLKVRRHRARQALRQRLEQSCRLCAVHGCLDCTCGKGRVKAPG